MILENDGAASKTTKEKVKSLALKAKVTKEQTSDDSDSQGGSDEDVDEEEEVKALNLMPKENKAFVRGAWSDSEDDNEPQNDATCLMEIDSQEVCLKCDLLLDDWIADSGCNNHINENSRLFTSYKAYDGRHVEFGRNLKGKVMDIIRETKSKKNRIKPSKTQKAWKS
nr:hypothetical protein [Tanacetum cinerariifolium]